MPREQPDQTYLPAAFVRLIVRFDDFGARNIPAPPEKLPQLRKGTGKDNKQALQVKEVDGGLVLSAPSDNAEQIGGPQEQTKSDDNRTHVLDKIIPAHVSVQRNGIRTADTATVELKFVDLPIDPRVIRSCAVEIFMGCLTQEDFGRGVRGDTTGSKLGESFEGEGDPLNVLSDTFVDAQGNERSNLRFQGWVDEWETEFPEGDEPLVRLECTDNTRLLIEQDAPPKLTIGAEEPIDKAIANYLANFPQFRGLQIEYRPAGAEVPKLKDALAKTAFKPKLGPPAGGGSKFSVWDYLADVCGAIGHTVRFDGVKILVQRARTLYANEFGGRPDDPFKGRVLPSGRELKNRTYIYGRNIQELTFKRKFSRAAPQNIEVRSYSGRTKKTLVARFPLPSQRLTKLVPGNAADQKWIVIPVEGVEDEKTLRIIAQGVFESRSRNEMQVDFTTKSLGSFGGGNLNPDALDCQPGDAIDVEVNRELEGNNTIGEAEEAIATKAEEFLRSLGYSAEFARAYGEASSNLNFPRTFRVRSLVLDWAWQEGISLSFEVINYLTVRVGDVEGPKLPEDEEIKPSDTAGAQPEVVRVDEEGL